MSNKSVDRIIAELEAAERAEEIPNDLVSLRAFTLSTNHEDKAGPMLSRTVRQSLEVLARAERVSIVKVFCWTVSRGLTRIEGLPDTKTIVRAFGHLLDSGVNVALLDSWTYTPDREGMRRLSMHNVPRKAIAGRCADLAKALGLSASSLYGLAVRAGLAGVLLPGDLSEQLEDDIAEFKAALRKRAKLARRVSANIQASKPGSFEWDE